MDTVVAYAADDRALFDLEYDVLVVRPVGGILNAQLHVLKELRVPKSLEIATQSLFVVRIAIAAENARPEGVAANAPVVDEDHAVNDGFVLLRRRLLEGAAN